MLFNFIAKMCEVLVEDHDVVLFNHLNPSLRSRHLMETTRKQSLKYFGPKDAEGLGLAITDMILLPHYTVPQQGLTVIIFS